VGTAVGARPRTVSASPVAGATTARTERFVEQLGVRGTSVKLAELHHWPVPGAAGTTRTEKPGPVDDLVQGVRHGEF